MRSVTDSNDEVGSVVAVTDFYLIIMVLQVSHPDITGAPVVFQVIEVEERLTIFSEPIANTHRYWVPVTADIESDMALQSLQSYEQDSSSGGSSRRSCSLNSSCTTKLLGESAVVEPKLMQITY